MSWFGSAPTPKKSTGTASTELFGDIGDIDDIHVDDADIENDAALLAELAGLQNSMGISSTAATAATKKAPQKPAPKQAPRPVKQQQLQPPPSTSNNDGLVDIELPVLDFDDAEPNVVLTDADLEDPDLLSELAAEHSEPLKDASDAELANLMHGMDMANTTIPSAPAKTHRVVVPPVEESIESVDIPEPVQQEPVSPHSLLDVKKRQLEYKQAALAFKQRGDAPTAREMLKVAKSMQDTIDLAESGSSIKASFKMPPPPPAPAAAPPPTPKPTPVATPAVTSSQQPSQIKRPSTSLSPKQTATPTLSQTNAYATSSTSRQQAQPQIQQTTSTPSLTQTPSLLANNIPLLKTLHSSLTSQIATCTQIAHYSLKSKNQAVAVDFHKRKKLYQSDLEVLETIMKVGEAGGVVTWPSFRYEVVRFEIDQVNTDIGLEELEIAVVRGYDYASPKGSGIASMDLETYVTLISGQSPVASKSASPEYAFSKRIKIDRGSRNFLRHVERKRVVVDVLHQVKGWGGLSLLAGKPVPVGRASVALSGLLTKAEVHEVVDLVDLANPRKLVGGKLEIKLRLQERWVVVDFSGQLNTPAPTIPASQQYVAPVQVQPKTSNVEATDETSSTTVESTTSASTLPVPKPITPQPASNAANSSRSSTPVAQQSNPIKKASTPIPTNPAPSEVDIEELEMEFLNPDAIASNNVLESEHTALLAQIAAHKKPVPDDLMDRKAGYELRMNLLVTLVSTGALTMNKYIENVKTNIGTTKKQALLLKQHGKVIMMEEVEEVEKAIAAGEL
ncbi:hypothetical protein BCR33DRAFT_717350 [Rhizoclosmatium globosum]|uniref:DM14 domain-containing protein n=1 Tax=Rhizoclosmatium globosum TaxID=329046 RepID=A0A1Y2CBG6_9FUNG|nr:hypothetical protein BCR33DRAFT_717350 [Rhizoclosmatium globosum]|eukprot:ORY43675.1 hypothetical protein BCR33DRAFT_717350 [Rhizoclosmatium globosum]